MYTSLLWACLSFANLCLAEPGVLSLRTFKNHEKHARALQKRDLIHAQKRGAFTVALSNDPYVEGGFYFVNVTVGTPPQSVQLDIDTGSSDVWMFGAHSCVNSTLGCAGGTFDESASTSLILINQGGFQIQYDTPGSSVTGDYVEDTFTIAKQTIKNLTMGVATQAESVVTGIMGIGFDTNEAVVSAGEIPQPYPNLIDAMQQSGLITTRCYSLYLDDLEAATGSIIFGGYDMDKFQGDLSILEIQPDAQSGTYSTFGVILNSVGVTDSTGSTVLTTSNMPNVVILDTGTSATLLPPDLFNELVAYFGAVDDDTYSWVVRCDLSGMTGTLDYQFAGPTGPLISVPFEELAVPLVNLTTGRTITDENGHAICRLGLSTPDSESEPLLFGDTFLRSAYVVYDLDNLQVGIAQTLFNVTSSNIQVISTGNDTNLPGGIASVLTTIAETKTQGLNPGAETFNTAGLTGTGLSTAIGVGNSGILTGYKTTYTNRATNIPGASSTTAGSTGSSKKNGAAGLKPIMGEFWKGLLVQGLIVSMASYIGARLIL